MIYFNNREEYIDKIEKILGDKNIKYNKKFEYIGNNNKKATYKDMEDFIDFAFKKINGAMISFIPCLYSIPFNLQ